MSFVYFNIWQIKQTEPKDFAMGLIVIESHNADERGYPDPADQIREVLIHQNYLSQKDVEICLGFDLGTLGEHEAIETMRDLHERLKAGYAAA